MAQQGVAPEKPAFVSLRCTTAVFPVNLGVGPMEFREKHVTSRNIDELLAELAGNVFHVTAWATRSDIESYGALRPCRTGVHSPFGNTQNGYFRLRGCVSFFDYRCYGSAEWEEHANKCWPTNPLEPERSLAIMFLNPAYLPQLRSWVGWKEEQAWAQRVVPYVECGFPGDVPLEAIDSCLHVSLL